MAAQTDIDFTLNRAAGLTQDAALACRSAARLPLPSPHRRLLAAAARKAESALGDLFHVQNDPWPKAPPKPRQLRFPV